MRVTGCRIFKERMRLKFVWFNTFEPESTLGKFGEILFLYCLNSCQRLLAQIQYTVERSMLILTHL